MNANGTEIGWRFNNDSIDGVRISDRLKRFIENDGEQLLFYCTLNRKFPRTKAPCIGLNHLLYSLHYGVSLERAKELNVEMLDNNANIDMCGIQIFDFTWGNLISDDILSAVFFSGNGENKVMGSLLRGKDTLCIHLPEKVTDKETGEVSFVDRDYTTLFDTGLCHVLNKVTRAGSWNIGDGALIADFWDGGNRITTVAFAEIVGTYFRGQIDMSHPVESIIENHAKLREDENHADKVLYDHLTHNKENNFPWALAPVTNTINAQMNGRDKIKPPYFFFVC